jgi:hypothetical protein
VPGETDEETEEAEVGGERNIHGGGGIQHRAEAVLQDAGVRERQGEGRSEPPRIPPGGVGRNTFPVDDGDADPTLL